MNRLHESLSRNNRDFAPFGCVAVAFGLNGSLLGTAHLEPRRDRSGYFAQVLRIMRVALADVDLGRIAPILLSPRIEFGLPEISDECNRSVWLWTLKVR